MRSILISTSFSRGIVRQVRKEVRCCSLKTEYLDQMRQEGAVSMGYGIKQESKDAEASADIAIKESLARFCFRVSDGKATSEELEFMSKVAGLYDQSKSRDLRRIAQESMMLNSKILNAS